MFLDMFIFYNLSTIIHSQFDDSSLNLSAAIAQIEKKPDTSRLYLVLPDIVIWMGALGRMATGGRRKKTKRAQNGKV